MSVHRFLSKRDKHRDGSKHQSTVLSHAAAATAGLDPQSAQDFYGLFFDAGKPTSTEEGKIKKVRQKIVAAKAVLVKDCHILWALRSTFSGGSNDEARDLLLSLSNASEGIIVPYDARTHMLGAVNRQGVTCYLDATLFAMFSRLDSFEAMLYNSFADISRSRLGFLLRLWVNLLRSGKLITPDITVHIQDALAECGWADAAKLHQQDASEAFTFVTEKLNLPLLTLKMDMFHSGKKDDDDHRFINERLLEVAIPAAENGEHKDIKLEDCLEEYFNNRIEVKRFLERRSTMVSNRSFDSISKQGAVHVETVELDGDASPLTPISPALSYTASRPPLRARTPSIIQERFVPEKSEDSSVEVNSLKGPVNRLRKGSTRKEVLMPAWQFFSLIPWYTDNAPSSDAQVADHFSSKRPILGLCLKRYSMLPNGKAIRLNTNIDIPVEIGLPHFIQDDHMDGEGPLYGNFKLSLQSVVCHRGNSVESGHYISLVRGTTAPGSEVDTNRWMRFDDLAEERITMIDIDRALRIETPYLLFYQIMPVDGDPGNLTAGEKPPPYNAVQASPGVSELPTPPERRLSMIASEPASSRQSLDLPSPEEFRGREPADLRRPSAISFGDHLSTRPKSKEENGDIDRRKSISTNRTGTVLTKTLSNLTGGRSKDVSPNPANSDIDVSIKVIGALVEDPKSSQLSSTGPSEKTSNGHDTAAKPPRKEKEKSRGRRGKSLSRYREEHPERECQVM